MHGINVFDVQARKEYVSEMAGDRGSGRRKVPDLNE